MKKLLLSTSLVFVFASMASANLIVNSDFSSGNTGFDPGIYEYMDPVIPASGNDFDYPLWGAYKYTITSDSHVVHPVAIQFYDHTSGDSSGSMLAISGVDPDRDSKAIFWSQTISVDSNTNYDFSLWSTLWCNVDPIWGITAIDLYINDNFITRFTLNTVSEWVQYVASWYSENTTEATISLVTPGTWNNNLCIDDIYFDASASQAPVPEPSTMLLFGTGIAGLAALGRRKKN